LEQGNTAVGRVSNAVNTNFLEVYKINTETDGGQYTGLLSLYILFHWLAAHHILGYKLL